MDYISKFVPNNPQLFNLDTETIEILANEKNKSKFVREAIKQYVKNKEELEKPISTEIRNARVEF